jgi:hypothetical protein
MVSSWTNPEKDVPLSDVKVLVLDDCNRMFLCTYNQSTYTYSMKINIDGDIFIDKVICNVKLWRYAPKPPKQ